MNEITSQETRQQALDLLQTNFATYDDHYSMQDVLPVVLEACDSPTELGSFLAPLRTANKLACWFQLPQELQEIATSTFPEKSDNTYYQNLLDHVTQGKQLPPDANLWSAEPLTVPSWESYYTDRRESVRRAELETTETQLVAGPHGNHQQREHDMIVAGIWMVCRQKSSKNWPIATHPERTSDALEFLSRAKRYHTFSRGALSIAGALGRLEDEEHWRQIYETSGLQGKEFRRLMQYDQLSFAMQRGDYTQAVTTEIETFPLRHDSLAISSLAALCTIIRGNHESSE